MIQLPPRYEAVTSLGRGGGGEVLRVRDRVTGGERALKVLAEGALEGELQALVREAAALSGLEGLGLPEIHAFGALDDGRRYLVRDLVVGRSLESILEDGPAGVAWLAPLADVCAQLALIHRAGFLHGDLKPANIIVGEDGAVTLVDLGLVAPWREGGAPARGLTLGFAAPELLLGGPLSARSEVYALGVTLKNALRLRGDSVPATRTAALVAVAERAVAEPPGDRFPSVAEFESALRAAGGLPPRSDMAIPSWPVLPADAAADALLARATELPPGGVLLVEGPAGSGRTSLLRRLAWALGVLGERVVRIEPRAATDAAALLRELASAREGAASCTVLVDDVAALSAAAVVELRGAIAESARAVVVGDPIQVGHDLGVTARIYAVPPLAQREAEALVAKAAPSLPAAVVAAVIARADGRPGRLRALVTELSKHAVVSVADLAELVDSSAATPAPSTGDPSSQIAAAERAFLMGRIRDAAAVLGSLGEPTRAEDRARAGVVRARLLLVQGQPEKARTELTSIEAAAADAGERRQWLVAWGRVLLRLGQYDDARSFCLEASGPVDALSADALSSVSVAHALTGDDASARQSALKAIEVAEQSADDRAQAVARGSAAIVDVYAGRKKEARVRYEEALAFAERARDAATVATTHLNLAALVQGEGELAQALRHLEAAVDMARRAGADSTLEQALLNLANLDLYLGRYARANASLAALEADPTGLADVARAQLLSLRAEHVVRTADVARGAALYEEAAARWLSLSRKVEAVESALEGLLARTRIPGGDAATIERRWRELVESYGGDGFGDHAALAALVHGAVFRLRGDEDRARASFDEAVALAKQAVRPEWTWQALDARANLSAAQGGVVLARKDTEAAIEILEAVASRLPRDLREVFWDDPRRKALRRGYTTTASTHGTGATGVTLFSPPLPEDRLARVLEMARELAREHDLPRLLARVTDHAIALLGAERGFVLLAGASGDLHAEAARDRRGDDPHARFSRSVTEQVIATGEPVVTVSARDDARLRQAVSVHQLFIQSIACVPIRSLESREGAPTMIGALYVETRLRPGVRFGDELPTLAAFADQAAVAIENARLLALTKSRAEELARANEELRDARDRLSELLGKKTEQLAVTRKHLERARAELGGHFGYGPMIGTSQAMRRLYALIDRVKATDIPVLVTGESGTGKELVARAIHDGSSRAKGAFVAVNCGAIPHNLLESELFGAVRGAYTGADRSRLGLVREADGGTLLLDEIGELPLSMQAGLLRVLQEMTVRPVGGDEDVKVSVRVIASTHRSLPEMVAAGTFREDLFYRLHVVELAVPPLRDRTEDIAPLVAHFIAIFAARHKREPKMLSRDALRRLMAYAWPGNVRQLEHVLLAAWLMADGGEITEEDCELPDTRGGNPPTASAKRSRSTPSTVSEQKELERARILEALAASSWNRARAAEILGLPRRTFYRRLKEFEILP